MLVMKDFVNIFLPVFSHWIVWLIFLIVVIVILLLYAYPYIRKPRKEFRSHHVGIPIANITALYIFTKMLEGVIYNGAILKVDALVNSYMQTLPSSGMDNVAMFITSFGSTLVITLLFTMALVLLLLKKRWRYALISTVAIVGALVLQVSIKFLVHRARPESVIDPTSFSFPSGHTIMAIVFVSLLIYSFKDDFKNNIVKYVLIILSSSFFVAVGISRIILHVHWFSDVVGGMSLGLFWFMSVVLIERSISGLIPAVKKETKEAKPIVPEVIVPEALKK